MNSWPDGILLADRACNADRPGPCCLCPYAVLAGQRVARMIDGTGWAHLGCLAALKPGPAQNTPPVRTA